MDNLMANDPTPPEAGQQRSVSPSAQPTPIPSIVGLREKAFVYVLLTGFLIGMFIFLGNELSTQALSSLAFFKPRNRFWIGPLEVSKTQ
jgi:hypothetical protein